MQCNGNIIITVIYSPKIMTSWEQNHCQTRTLAKGMVTTVGRVGHGKGTIVKHVHWPWEGKHCQTRTLAKGTVTTVGRVGHGNGSIVKQVHWSQEHNHCRTSTLVTGREPLSNTYIGHGKGSIVKHVHCPLEGNHCQNMYRPKRHSISFNGFVIASKYPMFNQFIAIRTYRSFT